MRKPSRERKRRVEERRSSWIVAKPKIWGDVWRRRSWLNVKVRRRVKSWRRIKYEAPFAEAEKTLFGGASPFGSGGGLG